MSDLLPPDHRILEAEITTLRAEVARLQAHQALVEHDQQHQERFRTIFEYSPLGKKIITSDLTIRQANAAIAKMLGMESTLELVGRSIMEFAHPDHVADWTHLQQQLWAHHLPWFALETCLVRLDGTLLWCRVTSVLIPDDGGELGYTTLEDISVRHALEAQVQQANQTLDGLNEKLQVTNEELHEANDHLGQVNSELDTFLYAASHDLRAPIANLEGLVRTLIEHLPAQVQQLDQVEPILHMMQTSMARFRLILDRMVDFNKGRLAADAARESIDLATVLEEVRQEVAPLLSKTSGQLQVELLGNSRLWFSAKYVHSVLVNLVSNALKYHHPDRAPVVRVHSYRESGQLVVRVQDNGLGLSEVEQQLLFRPFKRLHPHIEGMGMGLYLVKKILDNSGGRIRIESELDRGSTFIVFFPA